MDQLGEIQTPAFAVLLDVAERNARRMLEKAERLGLKLRVNIKTHKTVEGALLQCGGSPKPVVVSTLVEAEMLVANGFSDVLYGVPISESKLERVMQLNSKATVHVLLDHPFQLAALEQFSVANEGFRFSAFVKVDCGYGRAGVPVSPSGVDFCVSVAKSPYVHFQGIYTHSGHSYGQHGDHVRDVSDRECELAHQFIEMLRERDCAAPIVSVGSTPSCCVGTAFQGVTELHPGNYLFYDRQQIATGAATENDCACVVLARVISHYPDRNRVIVDAGSVALSKDTAPQGGYGHILGRPDLVILSASQEQSIIEYKGPLKDIGSSFFDALPIGGIVQIVPNHACLAAACHSEYLVLNAAYNIMGRWRPCKGW